MGRFVREAHAKVALVGLEPDVVNRLTHRLATREADEVGMVDVSTYDDIPSCRRDLEAKKVTAVCLAIANLKPAAYVAFIGDVRVTQPLVSFCLIGSTKHLRDLPGLHERWRARLEHYYKLETDVGDGDFDENAGCLRDLLIADAVKCYALGQYDTTPGAVVRIRSAAPYGFWLTIIVALLAAILGGAMSPLLERLLPDRSPVPPRTEPAIGTVR